MSNLASQLREEILFDNYGYPAADKAADELSLTPGYYAWVTPIWLFDADPFTIAQFMQYFPYGFAQVNDERLSSAVQHGYLAEEGSVLIQITSSGKQVRAEVEVETERLFFAPWLCLNEAELEELSSLAGHLQDGLK